MPELYVDSLFSDATLKHYARFEGSGADSSTANNAIAVGGDYETTYGTQYGKYGQGVVTKATSSYIQYNPTNNLRPGVGSDDYSLGFWCKTATMGWIYSAGYTNTITSQWAGIGLYSGGSNELTVSHVTVADTSNHDTISTTGVNVNDNAWHFYVVTYKNSTGATVIYVDGVSNTTGTLGNPKYSLNDGWDYFYIGTRLINGATAEFSIKALDEFFVFKNKILTAEEVSRLFTTGSQKNDYAFFM
jgi:hypothetical protein